MHQRGGVNQFHHGAQLNGGSSAFARQLGGKQHQGGAQTLAAGRLQILADGRDCIDGSHGFRQ